MIFVEVNLAKCSIKFPSAGGQTAKPIHKLLQNTTGCRAIDGDGAYMEVLDLQQCKAKRE